METVQEFLARGGKINVLPPGKESKALKEKQGSRHTVFQMGRKKVTLGDQQ